MKSRTQSGTTPAADCTGGVFLASFDSFADLETDNPFVTPDTDDLPWISLNDCETNFGMRRRHRDLIAQALSRHPSVWALWCVLGVRHVSNDASSTVQGTVLQYAVPILFAK